MDSLDTEKTADWIGRHFSDPTGSPILIVLGSGWGDVVEDIVEVEEVVAYGDIPGFPVSTVEGHSGRLVKGQIGGTPVWVMQGRFHYYEGYSMQEITFPVRVMARMGVQCVFLTNAAGGITDGFQPGQLMVIEDHINFMGAHPLRGANIESFGPRFPDMTEAWDSVLRDLLLDEGRSNNIALHRGTYLAVSGPSFETPAEIRAFEKLGASAVGMSTVPECIIARHAGLRVVGLSCITNVAAHVGGAPLTHEEVAEAAQKSHENVTTLLLKAIPRIQSKL